MTHGWTYHGHACCFLADSERRPTDITRCGGHYNCRHCLREVQDMHNRQSWSCDGDQLLLDGVAVALASTAEMARKIVEALA